MEELEIGDYINDINSYHLHMFDKHDVTTKKLDVIVEKAGKVDANYAAQIEGYCSLLGEYGKKFETVCAMLALDLIGVKVFRYSDETAEAVASGEKLLKESGTIYESFADMMSPEDAKRYLDFLENGSREGLTSAELAGVEKADALLVSRKVEYEDVWDLRNAGDVLESGSKGGLSTQGYSDFADGMLPEDATRCILNNEKAFFNEFSERASAVGLSDTQIAEAFEAMKNGDYAKMAIYFDTSSPVDGAVFWSGNKEGAAAYANSIGGTIMEQTPGGQVFDNWRGLGGMYPEWDTPTNLAQKPIWDALSSQYANGAEGIATFAHPDGYVGKVWSNIEKPILEENDIIIQEVIIDAK